MWSLWVPRVCLNGRLRLCGSRVVRGNDWSLPTPPRPEDCTTRWPVKTWVALNTGFDTVGATTAVNYRWVCRGRTIPRPCRWTRFSAGRSLPTSVGMPGCPTHLGVLIQPNFNNTGFFTGHRPKLLRCSRCNPFWTIPTRFRYRWGILPWIRP